MLQVFTKPREGFHASKIQLGVSSNAINNDCADSLLFLSTTELFSARKNVRTSLKPSSHKS